MALSITHTKVVVTPDDGTSEVGTNEWNDTHTISGTIDVDLASTNVTGNLAVTHLNSGTNASAGSVWAGDGTWKAIAGGSVAGADTQVIFNDGGAYAGDADFTWNKTTNTLGLASASIVNWASGDITLTHGANLLTFAGGNYTFNTNTNHIIDFGGVYAQRWSTTDAELFNAFISSAGTSEFGIWGDSLYFMAFDTLTKGVQFFAGDSGITNPLDSPGVTFVTNADTKPINFWTNGTARLTIDGVGNVILGGSASAAAISTATTAGFLWISGIAGVPAGTPSPTYASRVPLVVDTTDSKLYGYFGGAWTSLSGSGGAGSPGGANTQIQFNDGGSFGGDADFTWDKTTNTLTAGSTASAGFITNGVAPLTTWEYNSGGAHFTAVTSGAPAAIGAASFHNNAASPGILLGHSRSNTIGTYTVPSIGDELGNIQFQGADGTNFHVGAQIAAILEATASNNSMPSGLTFLTNPPTSIDPVERLRIDNVGSVSFGGAKHSGNTFFYSSPILEVNSTASQCVSFNAWNSGNNPALFFQRSRGANVGTHTVVQSGDTLGLIGFSGSDGTDFESGACIVGEVDATASADLVPGRLVFKTANAGNRFCAERMRIDSAGNVAIPGGQGVGTGSRGVDGFPAVLDVRSDPTSYNGISLSGYSDTGDWPTFTVFKSRGSVDSRLKVNNGDTLAGMHFYGDTGLADFPAAIIKVIVDATASAAAMPGLMTFATTPAGSLVCQERLRIDSAGNIVMGPASASAMSTATAAGFLWVNTVTATPTGTPSPNYPGRVPLVVDVGGSKLYGYIGGAWASLTGGGGSGTPGGADTQVQYNSGGAFAGAAGLTYASATGIVTMSATATSAVISGSEVNFGKNTVSHTLKTGDVARIYSDNGNANNTFICNGSLTNNNGWVFTGTSFQQRSDATLAWSGTTDPNAAADVKLVRDAAGALAMYQGTASAAVFRVYNIRDNTSGAPTNYERFTIDWQSSANNCIIGPEAGGTGTLRTLILTGGKVSVDTSNALFSVNGGANQGVTISGTKINVGSTSIIGWSSGVPESNGPDTDLVRDAAGILALFQGTASAAAFRVYNIRDNTSGAPTNYERFTIDWQGSANAAIIGAEAGGTGTLRGVFAKGEWGFATASATLLKGASASFTATCAAAFLRSTGEMGAATASVSSYLGASATLTATCQAATIVATGQMQCASASVTATCHAGMIQAASANFTATCSANVILASAVSILGTCSATAFIVASGITVAKRILETEVNLTDAASATADAALGNTFKLTATGNRIIEVTNSPASGFVQKMVIMHNASGADRTLTLKTGAAGQFRFGTEITALSATTSGLTDYIGAVYNDAADRWDVVSYIKGF